MQRSELIERWFIVLWVSGWLIFFITLFTPYRTFAGLWLLLHLAVLILFAIAFTLHLLWEFAIAPTLEYLMER